MPKFRVTRRRAWMLAVPACAVTAFQLLPTAPASAAGGCEYRSRLPAKASVADLRSAVACLVNQRRRAHGLPALRPTSQLRRAATGHSKSMVRHDYFSHYSRRGSSFIDRIRRAGYLAGAGSWSLGEVIATGSGWSATPRGVVHAWMHSAGHRTQILSSGFRDMGVGVAHGVPGAGARGATYTIDFGSRVG